MLPEILSRHGITPPPLHSHRTTCPMCSHARRKSHERCLSIFCAGGWVEWRCHHCGWQDGEALQ
jgi:C4-type Zn-finger protein